VQERVHRPLPTKFLKGKEEPESSLALLCRHFGALPTFRLIHSSSEGVNHASQLPTSRVLSVVDAYTRECLALEVDTSFASQRVTRVLDRIITERGRPEAIRCDNGPEFTSRHFLAWCVELGRSS
jgi:transposase InsO family protein